MDGERERTDRGLLRLYLHCQLLDRRDARERLEAKLGPELASRLVTALSRRLR